MNEKMTKSRRANNASYPGVNLQRIKIFELIMNLDSFGNVIQNTQKVNQNSAGIKI